MHASAPGPRHASSWASGLLDGGFARCERASGVPPLSAWLVECGRRSGYLPGAWAGRNGALRRGCGVLWMKSCKELGRSLGAY